MTDFADRFDPTTYEDAEPIGIGIESSPVDDWLFVPAPIFDRVLAIGAAYDLPTLGQLIARGQVTSLDATQCEGLLQELEWVGTLLADPLVVKVVRQISRLAAICTRTRDEHLVFDLED
jgi:hypothetical protein